jgi:hypothetical protein
MKRRIILIIALLTFSAPEHFVVGQKSSPECLKTIDRFFHRLSSEKLIAYEVNSDYFLRAEFQKNCDLFKIEVSPKYFWEYLNADWKEPEYRVGLLDDQYAQLLAEIDQIKPLGTLIRKGQAGEVTNATLWLRDSYTQSYIERGLRDVLGKHDEPMKVATFTIYFVRSVGGKVSDKRLSGGSTPERRARLKIDGTWYWVDEAEYRKAVVGKRGVFRAAGPVG